MRTAAIAIALAFAVSTLNALAEDNGGPPPPKGGPGGGGLKGGPGQGGFHLLPPPLMEKLNLTDDQKKQVADLEAEVKAKLAQILTPEQLQTLKQMRPPKRPGGPGGGGPGGGAGGAEAPPKGPRPPNE